MYYSMDLVYGWYWYRLTFVRPSSLGRIGYTGTPAPLFRDRLLPLEITLNIRHKKERKLKRVLCICCIVFPGVLLVFLVKGLA